MNYLQRFVILLMSMHLVYLATAQSPRAFYIGHSLSDQIPDMVQSLSNDTSAVDFSWAYQSIPGAPLRWQWDRKDANDYNENAPHYYSFHNATEGLPSGDFDILILTESVPRYLTIIDETYQYADSFYRYATSFNPNIKVYLYEDWHCLNSGTPTGCSYDVDANPWRQRLDDDLQMWESVVDTLNARFAPADPVCLIPAGQGLVALYDSIQAGVVPGLDTITDIFSDDIHLTDIGKYYIACIHFSMIHGISPVGLTEQTQVWWGGDFDPPSPALALKFQKMAWETVVNYPNSCVSSIPTKSTCWISTTAANWSEVSAWDNGIPNSGDTILFNHLAHGSSTLDIPGLMVESINMNGYNGTLTIEEDITVTGSMIEGGSIQNLIGDIKVEGVLISVVASKVREAGPKKKAVKEK